MVGAGWLFRNLIAARLTKSVEHEFNQKLEGIRSQFRDSEERLKSRIRAREAEVAALRTGALATMASRQAALDRRRLDAVDELWTTVTSLSPARALASQMVVIKFEEMATASQHDSKVREFIDTTIGIGFDPMAIDYASAAKARPFVTPMVWAVYIAIVAITTQYILRWKVLKLGIGPKDYVDHEGVKKVIVAVLPHYAKYLDDAGPDAYYYVLEALDSRLLEEIALMLSGAASDQAAVQRAAEIVRLATKIPTSTEAGHEMA